MSNSRFSRAPFLSFSSSRSSGDSIHSWAVARVAWCTTAVSVWSFLSAEQSPGGYRVSCTPVASARSSRLRLIANCMSCAANGARTSSAIAATAITTPTAPASCESLRLERPPKIQNRRPMSESSAIVPTAVTATVDARMS